MSGKCQRVDDEQPGVQRHVAPDRWLASARRGRSTCVFVARDSDGRSRAFMRRGASRPASPVPATMFIALLIVLLTVAVPLTVLAAEAQPARKIPRIGLLANVRSQVIDAFLAGLWQLGYVEGQNIAIEWRLADASVDT